MLRGIASNRPPICANPSKHRPQCCTCLMKLMRAVLWLALLVNLHIRGATVQGDLGVALELAKIQTRTSPLPSPPAPRTMGCGLRFAWAPGCRCSCS